MDLDTGFENNRNRARLSVRHRISELPINLEKLSRAPRIENSSFSAMHNLASASLMVLAQKETIWNLCAISLRLKEECLFMK